jgi:hypothetical protein
MSWIKRDDKYAAGTRIGDAVVKTHVHDKRNSSAFVEPITK